MSFKLAKKLFFISLILSCFFIPHSVLADDFDINIKLNQYSVYPGDIINFNTTIINNLNLSKEVNVAITNVEYSTWVTIKDYYFTLEPNKTKQFMFFISPDKDASGGTYSFDFDISYTKNNITQTINKKINFYVMDSGILDLDLKLNKTNLAQKESVNAIVVVKNTGLIDFKNALVVIGLKEKGLEEKIKINFLEKGKNKTISKTFNFDEFEQINKFTVSAQLYKTYKSGAKNMLLDEIKKTGTIIKKSKITTSYREYKDEEKNYTTLGEFIAKNTGNEPGNVAFALPILYPLAFYNFSTEPDYFIKTKITKPKKSTGTIYINSNVNETSSKLTAVWNKKLEPNQTYSVFYEINLSFIFHIQMLAIFFLIVYVHSIYSNQLKLYKKILKISENKTMISIELTNETRKDLEECEVVEFVPASLKIESKFDALPPDEIKRTKKGTYLRWIFKPFVAGEEIVMIYSVKPLLKTFGGITIKSTKAIAHFKRKKYIRKSDEINVCY